LYSLTGKLRNSVKSVLLFLQQDQPFIASWNTGAPGWKVQEPIFTRKIIQIKNPLEHAFLSFNDLSMVYYVNIMLVA
jgi:hypothetical protein